LTQSLRAYQLEGQAAAGQHKSGLAERVFEMFVVLGSEGLCPLTAAGCFASVGIENFAVACS
jgi:hypothetical protein